MFGGAFGILVVRRKLRWGMQPRGSYCGVLWYPWVVRFSWYGVVYWWDFNGIPPVWGLGVVFQVERCYESSVPGLVWVPSRGWVAGWLAVFLCLLAVWSLVIALEKKTGPIASTAEGRLIYKEQCLFEWNLYKSTFLNRSEPNFAHVSPLVWRRS